MLLVLRVSDAAEPFSTWSYAMVQRLAFGVSVWSIASVEVNCGMSHLPSLEHVEVFLQHENSSDEEMETAKAWLRRAGEAHPKRPTIQIIDW